MQVQPGDKASRSLSQRQGTVGPHAFRGVNRAVSQTQKTITVTQTYPAAKTGRRTSQVASQAVRNQGQLPT